MNHILRNRLNLRVTCLVNDLAALNVDEALLLDRRSAHKTVALSDGCVCHALYEEFEVEAEVLKALQETDGAQRVDYFVIECSGVADPLPLVSMLERRFGKMTRARLDALVVVVDADLLGRQLQTGGSASTASGSNDLVTNGGGDGASGAAASEEGEWTNSEDASSEEVASEVVVAAAAALKASAGGAMWRQVPLPH